MLLASTHLRSSPVIKDIEVLRAFAILMTIFHHRVWLIIESRSRVIDNYFTFWGGVDLFFVISGFVIGKGLLKSWRQAADTHDFSVEIVSFWIRRIWRIWPTSWFWMLVPLVLSLITHAGLWGDFVANLTTVAAIMSCTQNIQAFLWEHGEAVRGSQAYGTYWSLSLEEQFYILFPLALGFLNRKNLPIALVVGIAVQLFLPREVWSFLYAVRFDALLWGVLIALSLDYPLVRKRLDPVFLEGRGWKACLCTATILLVSAAIAAGHFVPFFLGMIGLFSAILVLFASYDKSYILPEGRIKRVMLWIGSRSYAIYMTHMPCYYFTREIWAHIAPVGAHLDGKFAIPLVLTALPMIVLFSELNFRFIETPLRRHGATLAKCFRETRLQKNDLAT